MSGYEELMERCESACYDTHIQISHNEAVTLAKAVLAEVLRTLETVTPEMRRAAQNAPATFGWQIDEEYLAMLRASPLTPPL